MPKHQALQEPLFKQLEMAVWEMQNEFVEPQEGAQGKRKFEPTEEEIRIEVRRRLPKMEALQPTQDDEFVLSGFGLGLAMPAMRVGDAFQELKRRKAPDAICRLFMTMVEQTSPDCALQEAIGTMLDRHQQAALATNEMKQKMEALQTHASATASTDTETSGMGMARVLAGMGKTYLDTKRAKIGADKMICERYVRGIMVMCAAAAGVKRKGKHFDDDVVKKAMAWVVQDTRTNPIHTRNVIAIVQTYMKNAMDTKQTKVAMVIMRGKPEEEVEPLREDQTEERERRLREAEEFERVVTFTAGSEPQSMSLSKFLVLQDPPSYLSVCLNGSTWDFWAVPDALFTTTQLHAAQPKE